MSTWSTRPNLKGAELIAWALTTIADAIDNSDSGAYAVSVSIDHLTEALYTQGVMDQKPALQYLADRIGGNLERLADGMPPLEK